LAEVLITLAIIGVIAAITIPSIIANHQKRAFETQFAKTYRTLQQAINLAVAEHGDISTWDWKNTYTNDERDAIAKKYILPYLNVIKFCPADNSVNGCMPEKITMLNNASQLAQDTRTLPSVLLADGTSIIIYPIVGKDRAMAFEVDVNGKQKPNVVGRDNFAFNLYPITGELLPHGVYDKNTPYDEQAGGYTKLTAEQILENCGGGGDGWDCAARITAEGFKINY